MSGLEDLRERSGIAGRVYAQYKEWFSDLIPQPIHPTLGPHKTPDVCIVEITQRGSEDEAGVHVEHACVHAGAPFEAPDHPDNKKTLAVAEYICALINAHGCTVE